MINKQALITTLTNKLKKESVTVEDFSLNAQLNEAVDYKTGMVHHAHNGKVSITLDIYDESLDRSQELDQYSEQRVSVLNNREFKEG